MNFTIYNQAKSIGGKNICRSQSKFIKKNQVLGGYTTEIKNNENQQLKTINLP